MYQVTNFAAGSTGTLNVPVDFTPTGFKITLCKKIGTTQNNSALSVGWCDGTNQWCESFFQSDTAGKRFQSSSKVVSHWSSTTTEEVAASFSSITSGGSPTIDLNVTATNANYNWNLEYWD